MLSRIKPEITLKLGFCLIISLKIIKNLSIEATSQNQSPSHFGTTNSSLYSQAPGTSASKLSEEVKRNPGNLVFNKNRLPKVHRHDSNSFSEQTTFIPDMESHSPPSIRGRIMTLCTLSGHLLLDCLCQQMSYYYSAKSISSLE